MHSHQDVDASQRTPNLNSSSFMDSHRVPPADVHTDTHTDANAHTNPNPDTNPHANADPHTNTDRVADRHSLAYCDANSNIQSNGDPDHGTDPNRNPDPKRNSDPHPNADSDADANALANPDAHQHAIADRDADTNPLTNSNSLSDQNANSLAHTDTDPDQIADANRDPDTHYNCDPYAHGDPDADANAHANPDAYHYSDPYPNTDSDADQHANGNAHVDAIASPKSDLLDRSDLGHEPRRQRSHLHRDGHGEACTSRKRAGRYQHHRWTECRPDWQRQYGQQRPSGRILHRHRRVGHRYDPSQRQRQRAAILMHGEQGVGDSADTNADTNSRADTDRHADRHRITVANRRHNCHAISHSLRLTASDRYLNGHAAPRDSDGDANAPANRHRLTAPCGDANTVDDEHGLAADSDGNSSRLTITHRQPDGDPGSTAVGNSDADANPCSVSLRW